MHILLGLTGAETMLPSFSHKSHTSRTGTDGYYFNIFIYTKPSYHTESVQTLITKSFKNWFICSENTNVSAPIKMSESFDSLCIILNA